MANKIPWYVTLDWKNITGLIGVLAIIGGVVFFIALPNIIQDNKLIKYKGETTGIVISITDNKKMEQSHEGTKIYVGSHTVKYLYKVDGRSYNGSERVKATPKTRRILNNITTSESKRIVVKYDESRPTRSTILID